MNLKLRSSPKPKAFQFSSLPVSSLGLKTGCLTKNRLMPLSYAMYVHTEVANSYSSSALTNVCLILLATTAYPRWLRWQQHHSGLVSNACLRQS